MSDDKFENGTFQGHTSCPECGSSDGLAIYTKKDETDGYCWVCNTFFPPDKMETVEITKVKRRKSPEEIKEMMVSIDDKGYSGWIDRRLTKTVAQKYGVKSDFKVAGKPNVRYYPVHDESGELCGYKVRVVDGKRFWTVGTNNNNCQMFGQHLFASGGDILIITGGEEDTLSWYQCLANNDKGYYTPVVSVTCGESSAVQQVKNNYDYITSFDKVIISMDNDKVGRKAAEGIARVLKPGQGYIPDFQFKDASEALSEGRGRDLQQYYWRVRNNEAEPYSPVGIIKLSQMWSAFEDDESSEMIPLPEEFGKVNTMFNGGIELGEITVVGALTSIGKTTIVSHIVNTIMTKTNHKIGAIYLEGTQREVVRDIMSIHTKTNLRRVPRKKLDMRKLRQEFLDGPAKDDRFVFVDHQGLLGADALFDKMQYLTKVEGCKVIIIDPIQAAVQSTDNAAVIEFMDRVLKLAKQTNVAVILVSHMRKPEGKDPHDVSEYDLMGCVDRDTEFLTKGGWKKISEYTPGDEVMNYNIETGESFYETPKAYVKLPCDEFYHMKSVRGVDMMLSSEHNVIFRWGNQRSFKFIKMQDVYERNLHSTKGFTGRFPTTFRYYGSGKGLSHLSEIDIRMAVAYQADGTQREDLVENHVSFVFRKERKKKRIMELIHKGGYVHSKPWTGAHGNWGVRVKIPYANKEFDEDWWDVNKDQAEIIWDEIFRWDGYDKTRNCYVTTNENNANYVQYLAAILGKRATITVSTTGRVKPLYEVNHSKNDTVSIANKDRKPEIRIVKSCDGYKYCFTTSTGAWVARRGGKIFPTGNSGSINQIAFNTILISRDKMHSDPIIRNSTRVAVVKCRRTGETGEAGWFTYDPDTTLIHSAADPYKGADIRAAMTDLDDGMTMDDLGSGFDADDDFANYE